MQIYELYTAEKFRTINVLSENVIYNMEKYINEGGDFELQYVKQGKPSDYYALNLQPAFTQSLFKEVSSIFKPYGRFLEVSCEGDVLQMFICENMIDCFDKKKSKYQDDGDGIIYLVKKMIFKKKLIGDQLIFRVPEFQTIFYTELAVEKLKHIKGIDFVDTDLSYRPD